MKRIWFALTMMVFAGLVGWVEAQENNANRPGQVQLPLEIYTQLIQQAQPGDRHAPVNFALGNARVSVTVRSLEPAASAEISVALSIQIFEDEWALVPVLPAGTPVTQATVQGTPVQLVATRSGLAWTTNQKGTYAMQLSYRIDAASSENGYVLGVPVPEAASINLSASLPGTGLDVAVIPAADFCPQAAPRFLPRIEAPASTAVPWARSFRHSRGCLRACETQAAPRPRGGRAVSVPGKGWKVSPAPETRCIRASYRFLGEGFVRRVPGVYNHAYVWSTHFR